MRMRTCANCNKELELNNKNFAKGKREGTYVHWCRKCVRNRAEQTRYHTMQEQSYSPKVSRQAISKWVQSYKEGKV
jgi:hypothetical protein